MNSSMSTILKVLSWLLMGISIVLTVVFYTGKMDIESVQSFIVWAYILFALAVAAALIFPLYFFFLNPKNALRTLMGLAIMGVVFLIGYLMADATPIYSPTQNPDLSNTSVLVLTDTGLIATYVMFGAAMLLLLYSGVKNVFNK